IGFVEGEGTFGIKTGSSMYLQVSQKNTSIYSINAIIAFLNSLKSNLLKDSKILPINILSTINKKTNVISVTISSVDALYYYILPLLDNSKMYTFKKMDFKLWRMALLLKIQGYYYLPEGKKLFLDISDILNKRYSTGSIENLDTKLVDIINRYQAILLINPPFNIEDNIPHVDSVKKFRLENKSDLPKTPPFDVNSGRSHFDLSREFTIAKGGRKGFIVYIYLKEDNGYKAIEGSPFSSYGAGHLAIGQRAGSRVIGRYIDTGRIFKDQYLFSSVPLEDE